MDKRKYTNEMRERRHEHEALSSCELLAIPTDVIRMVNVERVKFKKAQMRRAAWEQCESLLT